jgi:hypothetical protein
MAFQLAVNLVFVLPGVAVNAVQMEFPPYQPAPPLQD